MWTQQILKEFYKDSAMRGENLEMDSLKTNHAAHPTFILSLFSNSFIFLHQHFE